MLVRNAEIKDVREIGRIDHLCFPRDIGFKRGSIETILEEHPKVLLLVSEYERQVAGYIFVIPQDGSTDRVLLHPGEAYVAQVASLAVDPDFRGLASKSFRITAMSGCQVAGRAALN